MANTYVIQRHVICNCAEAVMSRQVLAGSDGTIPRPPEEDRSEHYSTIGTGLKVFPNPAAHTLQLAVDQVVEHPAIVKLYTATGQLVQTTTIQGGTRLHSVDVEQLSSGVYYVVLESQGERYQQRFVKQ